MSILTAVRTSVPTPLLTVDLPTIGANVRAIRAAAGDIMAVVKADGFGHGAVEVASTALAGGASSLGVATIAEAVALRDAGIRGTILSWLNPVDADFDSALRDRVDLAIPGVDHLQSVAAAARRTRTPAPVHLHVDVGMARDGAGRGEWFALATAARRAQLRGEIAVVGVMGHLACAEAPGHPSTAAGRESFLAAVAVARGAGLQPSIRHLAATAAALGEPDTRFDLSRIGAGLYGIGPGLREALTLVAPVVSVRDVPAGTPVGYGHTYTTDRPTRLALVPLGYGDGVPRVASNRAEVLVHGRRRPVAGMISMDQLVVDVGELPVGPGDNVTVFGAGGPTVTEWAEWSHTIPHEIMTGLGSRIQRVHRRGVAP